jgi:uncharacterized protein YneF (UPF0154 family)
MIWFVLGLVAGFFIGYYICAIDRTRGNVT